MSLSIFIVGGTGFLGRHLLSFLSDQGHNVRGLARQQESLGLFQARGAHGCLGDLTNEVLLRAEFSKADAIIYCAQFATVEEEAIAIRQALALLENTNKIFIMTSGTGVLSKDPGGVSSADQFAEDSVFTPYPPLAMRVTIESEVRLAAAKGLRSFVIRPPQIYGHGGSVAIPMLFAWATTLGYVPYVNEGLNIWGNVHIDDLVILFERVLLDGKPGSLFHAEAGEHTSRAFAEVVANICQCHAKSITNNEALLLLGGGHEMWGCSSRSVANCSRQQLNWLTKSEDMFTHIKKYRAMYLPAC